MMKLELKSNFLKNQLDFQTKNITATQQTSRSDDP